MTSNSVSDKEFFVKLAAVFAGDPEEQCDILRICEPKKILAFLDTLPHAIFIKDGAGHYLYCNSALATCFGKSREEMQGQAQDLFQFDKRDSAVMLSDDQEVLNSKSGKFYDTVCFTDAQGGKHFFKTLKIPVCYGPDQIPCILGLAVDFTRETLLQNEICALNAELEARVKEKTRELSDKELRYRKLTENIPCVFWLVTAALDRVLYVSPAYEKLWGFKAEKVYDDPRAWVECIYPEDRDRVRREYYDNILKGTYSCTYRITDAHGGVRWVNDSAFPVKDSEGKIIEIAGIVEDITYKKKAEESDGRNAKLSALGTLVAGVAHELNNPIGTILLTAQHGAEKYKDTDPSVARMLDGIVTDAHRCREIIEGILHFSVNRPVSLWGEDIGALVDKYMKSHVFDKFRDSRHSLTCKVDPDTPKIKGNSFELERMIYNLISNSFEAGATLVKVEVYPEGDFVFLTVQDNGMGIAVEDHARIFDPFFTTKSKGNGLGLPIVYQIVVRHDADISFGNSTGGGVCFKVKFKALKSGDQNEEDTYC